MADPPQPPGEAPHGEAPHGGPPHGEAPHGGPPHGEPARSTPPQQRLARRSVRGLLLVSLVLAALTLAPMWKPLLLGAVLAGVTYPAFRWLKRRVHAHAYVAAGLMAIGVVVLVLFPFCFLGAIVVREGIQAVAFIRDALADGGLAGLAGHLPGDIESALTRVADALGLDDSAIAQGAAAGGWSVAQIAASLVAAGARALVSLGFMMIAYVALLVDGPRLVTWVEGISPLERTTTTDLLQEFRRVSSAVLGSAVVSMIAQGIALGIGYAIAGVPNVLFFAVITGFASLIPIVGTQLIALPLAAALLLGGHVWQGMFLVVWGLLAGTIVDNTVRPLVIKGGMQMSGAVVFFALLGGLSAFGLVGAVLGPLAITFFVAMVRLSKQQLA